MVNLRDSLFSKCIVWVGNIVTPVFVKPLKKAKNSTANKETPVLLTVCFT